MIIYLIIGFLVGAAIAGFVILYVVGGLYFGTIKIAKDAEDGDIYMFVELNKDVRYLVKRKWVLMSVDARQNHSV